MEFQYGVNTIEFEVEYRDRKTLEIRIEPPSSVKVIAPRVVSEDYILRVVKSKEKWIMEKLSEFKDKEYTNRKKEYVDGETFMYLGNNYPLEILVNSNVNKILVKLEQGKFSIETNTKDEEKLRKAMEGWYRQRTSVIILERVQYFLSHFNVNPKSIKVKEQRKRWGSCNSRKDLMFNWRCSMAPSDVLDYIVVHEMCHMIQLNHSKKFWDLVENVMPDYKEKKEWLKKNGFRMFI